MKYKHTFLLMTLFTLSTSTVLANESNEVEAELPPMEQCQQYALEDGIEKADLNEYIESCLNELSEPNEMIEGSGTEELATYEDLTPAELCQKYAEEDNIGKQEIDAYLDSCIKELNTPDDSSQN
jgi:hypothetical protein